MASFVERVIGAAKLDAQTYEEVEADKGAIGQALTVVVLSSIAGGIGAAAGQGEATGTAMVILAVVYTIIDLIGWFIWAFLTFLIGTKLMPEPQTQSDMGELLRTTGFSAAPGMLKVLGVVPFLGVVVRIVVYVWMLAAFVVAVRQALDYQSTGRAIVVCLIGWVVQLIFVLVVAVALIAMVGIGAAMTQGAG